MERLRPPSTSETLAQFAASLTADDCAKYSDEDSTLENPSAGSESTPKKPKAKKREVHNMVERMRRYRISSCIAHIAVRIPNLGPNKLDKRSVLDTALRYLKYIRKTCTNIGLIDEAYMNEFGGGQSARRRKDQDSTNMQSYFEMTQSGCVDPPRRPRGRPKKIPPNPELATEGSVDTVKPVVVRRRRKRKTGKKSSADQPISSTSETPDIAQDVQAVDCRP